MLLKILGLAIIAIAIMMIMKNLRTPAGLGVQDGRLAEVPETPNGVSTQTSVTEKKVETLPFSGSIEESKFKILEAVKSYGGAEVIIEEEDYLYIIFTTGTMKFKDDAEFYFDANTKEIHFRSASRVGKSDLGLNRERYDAIRRLYME